MLCLLLYLKMPLAVGAYSLFTYSRGGMEKKMTVLIMQEDAVCTAGNRRCNNAEQRLLADPEQPDPDKL
ncbi:hypothetical protein [Bacteroides cellulosilyticus]|uniref:hypothetical protein n=1 Tax=Bacteroides cellulosilyticus TaxID=246787 RepID=UPI002F969F01